MRIGVVGHGFVGGAVSYGFGTSGVSQFLMDPKLGTKMEKLIAWRPTVAFVCLPTPSLPDGSVDYAALLDVVSTLTSNRILTVIKSTVTPDFFDKLPNEELVVYSPEFLVQSRAKEDFVNPTFHVFGGSEDACEAVANLYERHSMCAPCPSFFMSHVEASLVKYAVNSYLSTKVTFFNQLYDLAEECGSSFIKIANAVSADPRIGISHTRVPGFDGERGFGGACFPKDLLALSKFTGTMSLSAEVLAINERYRGGGND